MNAILTTGGDYLASATKLKEVSDTSQLHVLTTRKRGPDNEVVENTCWRVRGTIRTPAR